ncbi:alpha/beta hydrolase [Mycobacterium sp. CBMA293]|uniref:alpha/beta hydrolase n=1 Tax=unclassified Mycolicibacterium TaxID=2636767 RepID=UPI0012DD838D|nr:MULTISPECIES: alpha/beta hydrolase [unclassified Mycolicibacterium]MUL48315.1 alpha/beta hydrolase [Mycolicibacterium sp. CBMA 360]MUL57518.1 alpha/beta hydrolase [Mycolicibacterium sp. CBMA 335]MUL70558.1 alpha/beta hydrolase [Mycolicibacterium sp. CBMA 311]MUL92606.1 alpha/beta hydrolase [Mycolicibacterium sp. CBMA 230]MUM04983.1 alpha/beta hydrolase [Mycolicibacterium sp. CBMA 213]
MKELYFYSHGVRCAAWHLPAATDELAGAAGRPCVVMAHGFSGTKDTALLAFAEPFAEAGLDVLVFDYRGFGASEGVPRQDVSVLRQRQDYHAAIAAARHLPGVDADRIVLWGTSYAGGHVIAVAARDKRIAAVISMNPAVDGVASLVHLGRTCGIGYLLRSTANAVRDIVGSALGKPAHMVPVVGQPGSAAVIATSGAEEAWLPVAGPTWRNEVRGRHALGVALNRPIRKAAKLTCPILVQPGTDDRIVPAAAARKAARRAGYWAQLREYAADHLDFYDRPWQQRVLADQLDFLKRDLAPTQGHLHEIHSA